jgi:hypothetical protein
MNLTDHIPAAGAMSPLTFPSVNWREKEKVFLLAKRLSKNWQTQVSTRPANDKAFSLSPAKVVGLICLKTFTCTKCHIKDKK